MTVIPSFAWAERYLLGTISETVSPRTSYKLDRMRALLAELGDPHAAYPTVHVGGTSGKGSTATMIASALQAAGKRAGLHTKPHLHSATERARVDGSAVSPERFAALLEEMMPAIERVTRAHSRPTYYETLLALAFLHFARERVDVAVIEVGLGGRLDGTNVISPRVAAMTSIGYDHMDVLGDTLEAIAREKAGIAKPGVPLVVADVPAEAMRVVERHAAQVKAPLVRVRDAVRVEARTRVDARGEELEARTERASYVLELPLLGGFQRLNAATAIAVLERLGDDLRPDRAAVERGFARLALEGRMELFPGPPAVVFDIAHNAEKAEHLVAAVHERFAGRHVHYVVAIGESKDARRILDVLCSVPEAFTLTCTSFTAAGRRSVAPRRLAVLAESLGHWARAIDDPVEALSVARRTAAAEDLIVVTGSTFVVATLREWNLSAAAR